MRLKKLTIQGFKSFADKVEMTFEQGITGIVGPNGSGKSNVSDAVRWVLGEQSAKTLRGMRMEDIIFNGTEKRRPMAFCEVSLTFDNAGGELPVSYTEVEVTRRVYRSGESEYQLNKTACRLRDIIDLFRDTGIGKEGYSLIGQGRIDEILSVKSEDRRQVFEEAAGIVKYKARKTEAERRIENTRANLARVEDIIQELHDRLEPLKEQSEAAREYLALRDELREIEISAFVMRSDRLSQRIAQLRESVDAFARDLERNEADQHAQTRKRQELEEKIEQIGLFAQQKSAQVMEMTRDAEVREGEAAVLRERISAAQRECARLQSEIEAARDGGGGMDAQIAQKTARLVREREALAQMGEALKGREQELRDRELHISKEEGALDALKQQVIDMMNRLSDVRSASSRLKATSTAISERLEALALDQAQHESRLDAYTAQLREAQEALSRETAARDGLGEQLQGAEEEVRRLAEEAERLQSQMSQITAKRHETASRLRVLEEMERDYEGYQNAVKQVLLHAKRTPDAGVHGVVATLIQVPKELERAIEMVLGGALQNVVVDTEQHAKLLIGHLRNNRLGRATFLPISAVRGRTLSPVERGVLSMPGCLGVASELIGFDPKYQGIADSLLGRTVVARDLDAGIAIQRKGGHAFRLVTLEGDVMHSGGSMTGGSVYSRMTSLLSRERETNEHRQMLKTLDEQIGQGRMRQEECEERRAQAKQERGALFAQLHQQEIAQAREEAHCAAAQSDLQEHTQRLSRIVEDRQRLEAQKGELEAQMNALLSAQGNEEQTGEGRQQEIFAKQQLLMGLRAQADAQREALTRHKVEFAAKERDLSALSAEIERLNSQRTELGSLILQNTRSLAHNQQALQADEGQLARDVQSLEGLRAGLAKARAEYEAMEAQRAGEQQALRKVSQQLDEMRGLIADLSDKRHRAEMALSRGEAELAQLQNRIWEEYELTYEGAMAQPRKEIQLTEAERRAAEIRAHIRRMGTVNVGALDEYRQTQARHQELSTQKEDLLRAEADLGGIIGELMKKMEVQFRAQFAALNENFQQTFVKLFGGGQAELRLEDNRDVLNCGIEIVAQPPGKKLQMLSLLSGGERALTAIAILFAMLKLKPTPFCMLDEIEAALDDANIGNFAEYLAEYAQNTQFVVVTHRKGTMARCDALYGIAMEEKGISRMVSVQLEQEKLKTG